MFVVIIQPHHCPSNYQIKIRPLLIGKYLMSAVSYLTRYHVTSLKPLAWFINVVLEMQVCNWSVTRAYFSTHGHFCKHVKIVIYKFCRHFIYSRIRFDMISYGEASLRRVLSALNFPTYESVYGYHV